MYGKVLPQVIVGDHDMPMTLDILRMALIGNNRRNPEMLDESGQRISTKVLKTPWVDRSELEEWWEDSCREIGLPLGPTNGRIFESGLLNIIAKTLVSLLAKCAGVLSELCHAR